MTSIARSYFSGRTLPAAPGFVVNYFTNSDGTDQPFPWRYNKQNQTIDLEFVDGFTNSTSESDTDMFFRGQQFGASKLVLGLGANFIDWCENSLGADVGTVKLIEKPIVVTANAIANNQGPNSGGSNSSTEPISFENSFGSLAGKYSKTLVFMKPMVITYEVSGTLYYRWFSNNFEGNT
jgi:hypothetical protein